MAPFEALYGKRSRSPIGLFDIGEVELIGTGLVHQAMEKVMIIKKRLKIAQSHQKSYSDVRRGDLELKENDWVFLKRIGQVAYKFELPLELSLVQPVFHVSMLKKVVGDLSLIVLAESIE
uniref:Tf2-1-like SH3-like domain-containing protein n=1 Tax=Nicotiana tabacum TaxID=4097 RepID=A0A1S4ASZ0_TOBAC